MTVVPLLNDQPVTAKGDRPSHDLVEVIQRLVAAIRAVGAVPAPTGGATVDTEARAALAAIVAAVG